MAFTLFSVRGHKHYTLINCCLVLVGINKGLINCNVSKVQRGYEYRKKVILSKHFLGICEMDEVHII